MKEFRMQKDELIFVENDLEVDPALYIIDSGSVNI